MPSNSFRIPRNMVLIMMTLAMSLGLYLFSGFVRPDSTRVRAEGVSAAPTTLPAKTDAQTSQPSAPVERRVPPVSSTSEKTMLRGIGETLLYSAIGVIFFILTWYIVNIIMPFSVIKEIEEDQNTSLGIIIGAMMLGVAIIIAAVVGS